MKLSKLVKKARNKAANALFSAAQTVEPPRKPCKPREPLLGRGVEVTSAEGAIALHGKAEGLKLAARRKGKFGRARAINRAYQAALEPYVGADPERVAAYGVWHLYVESDRSPRGDMEALNAWAMQECLRMVCFDSAPKGPDVIFESCWSFRESRRAEVLRTFTELRSRLEAPGALHVCLTWKGYLPPGII